jgi:hypothetical protein
VPGVILGCLVLLPILLGLVQMVKRLVRKHQ